MEFMLHSRLSQTLGILKAVQFSDRIISHIKEKKGKDEVLRHNTSIHTKRVVIEFAASADRADEDTVV